MLDTCDPPQFSHLPILAKSTNNEGEHEKMIIARALSSSSKRGFKNLLLPLSFLSPQNLPSLLISQQPNYCHLHKNQSSDSLPFFSRLFSSKSTTCPPSLPLTRDGNCEDATPPTTVCPGCGLHRQDASFESEFPNSLTSGSILEPGSPNLDRNTSQITQKPPVVCTRCHSLRHYGRDEDPTVENLLPEFDFDHTVGKHLMSNTGAQSVVLLVADAVDFDGSFPKRVAKLVSNLIEDKLSARKEEKSVNVPRIVLVVTKIDLLPSLMECDSYPCHMVSPTRFEHWVRRRARERGLRVIDKVHFVSSLKDWGMKSLVEDVIELARLRGNVWAIGAQNAGKSTLINAMTKCMNVIGGDSNGGDTGGEMVGGRKGLSYLTEAPVPGTTLGIVTMEGVLPGLAKLFDTPGLLQPQQITTRLTRDEQKLVHVSKDLKPRTYRIKEGHSVHIGGLMRLDIEELSVECAHVTVWASCYMPLHMGKTEKASSIAEEHFGCELRPPIGKERVQELGKWVKQEFRVSGNSWNVSSVDIAAAGLGWFAIGVKGEAVLGVWTYEGVDVVLRSPLIIDRAQVFEGAGFTIPKIISKCIKSEKKKRKSQNVAS